MNNLKSISISLIICFAMIISVLGTPEVHKASDGKEYLIENETKYNWHEAWNECSRRDSKLVIIDSEEKNNDIIELLKKVIGRPHNLWLGGNDEFSSIQDYNRPFFWPATGKKFTFTYWTENNPNNGRGREHCVHIWDINPQYKWNDADCGSKMGFICEVNEPLKSCNKDDKKTCDAVRLFTTSTGVALDNMQKQQVSAINTNIADIERVGHDLKIELHQMQNSLQVSIQKLLDEQQYKVKQLTEKMLKQVNNLGGEMRMCMTGINKQFGENFYSKQREINKIC